MKALYDLREMLSDELEEYSRKDDLSAGDLEMVHKLTDTIKNIDKICIMDEDGEYSQAGDWEARGHFGDMYDDRGNSYANRGQHWVRGHYSRADGRGGYRGGNRGGRMGRGYSRDGGREDLMEHIDRMMGEAETEQERAVIRRFKKELENA